MKPYYQDEAVTIYHGNFLEIVPDLDPVSLTVTDPPYGVGIDYGVYSDTAANLLELIELSFMTLASSADVLALTPGVGNIHKWPAPRWVLCWYMQNACASTGYWGFNQWQPVLVYGTDPYLKRGLGRRPDVIITAAPNNGLDKTLGHPCPKPIEAWRKIIHRLSPSESDTILDPMMGSGTTLEVCKNSGRKAIGIDISERFCEIAAKRMSQEVLPFVGGVTR